MTAAAPSIPRAADGRVSHNRGFWLVAAAFLTAMAFSTVPAPLYVLYERRDGFGSLTVTLVFAVYAVGVVVSLFLAGHISDWLGRPRILLPALLFEIAAGVVFLLWEDLPGLFVARFLTGVGVGMVTATATAHLAELDAVARPGAPWARSTVVGTTANIGGLAFGPLIAGVLAEWVGQPLRTPYVVFIALMLVAALAVSLAPETVAPPAAPHPYRPQRVSIPASARGAYFAVIAAAFVAFAVFGLFTSLAPTFVAVTMNHPSRALAGLVSFLVFGAAATTQIAFTTAGPRTQLAIGMATMTAGLAPIVAAVWIPSLPLFLLGGTVAGAGSGVLFKGAVGSVIALAPPQSRGEALAGFFLGAYLGLVGPVVGLGIATRYVAPEVALTWFAALLVAVIGAISPLVLRRPGH